MSEGQIISTTAKPIIGLAGGIGSGKSAVASILSDLGAAVISSDTLNHDQLNTPEVLDCLRQWWGRRVVDPHGKADRAAIRAIISKDDQARRRLEDLVHPRILQRQNELTSEYLADPNVPAIVIDSPLLYEVGLDKNCSRVIFIEANTEVRTERVTRERGWTVEDIKRLEDSQLPLDTKRENADYIIVNNSDVNALSREVKGIYSCILAGK